ncbi:MAG: ATP-dependent DNA helicase RecG [Paludibacteraceae bacterium]|nr:ATP-dependent DNA helicase RecG [Paludibacteraceae bacterium]
MDLSIQNIEYCKGVGTKRADILRKELGVKTALDMLYQFPYKYIDRSRFYYIHEIEDEDTYVQIIGHITEWHTVGAGATQRMTATFTDGRHTIELVWFKGIKYLKLERNIKYLLFGKPSRFNHQYNFVHPELTPMNKVQPEMTKGLEPHYNTTEGMKRAGINSKAMRTIISQLVPRLRQQSIPDTLGMDILEKYHMMGLNEALANIHFPSDMIAMQRARERLKFEELFYIQMQILRQMKRREQNDGFIMPIVGKYFHSFYKECLPFELTNAQKRVIKEIQSDIKSGKQMNRLLQGDVGSGKTMVALLTALLAIDNGYQVCIMAPTEILANQHYQSICEMLGRDKSVSQNSHITEAQTTLTNFKISLLTGSTTAKQRQPIHEQLRNGEINLLIGTHALIEDTVQFANLGLCIIDEQHRFGVAQRAKLWNKNTRPPHILVMTATPIPRTLAMTVYGDLQVSIIDELPPGRKPVQTLHYVNTRRASINQFIEQQITLGRQVYVVYPLIKENEKMELQDLQNGYNQLCQIFPQYRISMVHGQMRAKDKDEQMRRFASGETQILVATTVIEVGVNVPNASVMIIENAERFGLSQLHQLRGRVGRGAEQSYCILLTNVEQSKDTRKRMDIMVATNNGFRIAEADLQLRGPGDLEGTQQSGLPFELHIASLSTDGQLLELARQAALDILNDDPLLEEMHNRIYKQRLDFLRIAAGSWGEIS